PLRQAVETLECRRLFYTVPVVLSADGGTTVLSQNWTDPSLITAANNLSGVPGITGDRGDDCAFYNTNGTNLDLNTILTDHETPVNVIANGGTNVANTAGGIEEFDGLTDSVVALQGSATADFPHLLLYIDSTNADAVNISYNIRDVDST